MKKVILFNTKITLFFIAVFCFQKTYSQDIVAGQIALTLIHQNALKLGLSADDEQNLRISDAYTDKLSGALLVYAQQTYAGIDLDKSIMVISFRNNKLITQSGKRITNLPAVSAALTLKSPVSAFSAVNAAAIHLGLPAPSLINSLIKKSDAAGEISFGNLGIAANNIKAKRIWVLNKKAGLQLCWAVEVAPLGSTDFWRVKVDASTGSIIGKENYTVNCSWEGKITGPKELSSNEEITESAIAEKLVDEDAPPPAGITNATYNAVPYPFEAPSFTGGTPAVQNNPWNLSPAGSPATTLLWNSNGTIDFDSTRGNNVLSRVQHSTADNSPTGEGFSAHSTTASPGLTFNSPANFTVSPNTDSTFQRFSATNLFYWNNIMHDISYQYGFDEPSGNFQENNLARGGSGNDYVFAFAQYDNGLGGNINNSNFGTPPDGSNPVMHMFLFNYTSPWRDGDADEGVVCHEYTHGISNRLTGGPSNAACLQNAEQMGEGWSDYDAIMITTDWSKALPSDGSKKHPLGTYVLGQLPTGAGIRNYPYSTSLLIDPWTYAKMAQTQGEVHNVGEVWTTVLWEMTWSIIQMDGINPDLFNADGAGGNSVAMKLVYEGMKLQPCGPGFIDGRDGILKADTLLYGGKYSCAIWKAFAKRGMGAYASEGSPNVVGDETADFTIPVLSSFVKHTDKVDAAQNDLITYTFHLQATNCAALSNYTIKDTLPVNVTYVSSDGTYDAVKNIVTIGGINLDAATSHDYRIVVRTKTNTYFATVQQINEPFAAPSFPSGWTNTSTSSTSWKVTGNNKKSAPYSLFAVDTITATNEAFVTTASYTLKGASLLSFWHYFNVETNFDGGVVEISTDNGTTWLDAGKYMRQNGYNSEISSTDNDTQLKGRKAFSGNSGGFIQTIVNLSSFAGKSIKIRFLFATDIENQNLIFDGWYIDDIILKSESGVYNIAQLTDAGNALQATSDTLTTINSSLPVNWGTFTAVKNGNSALLNWNTLQEINTGKYNVERSNDGLHFETIGTVAAAGASSVVSKYNFTDARPLNGIDYYRLQQVDKNGNYVYSETRTLNFSLPKNIIISPNPAKDILNITVAGNSDALKLYLVNSQGQTVQHYNMSSQELQINLPKVAGGIYYIKIASPDGSISSHKIVIQ